MLILLCLRNACGIDILSSAETALTSHADHSHTHKAGHRTGVVSGGAQVAAASVSVRPKVMRIYPCGAICSCTAA